MLDAHGIARSGLWYVLSPENEGPSARVGHTCSIRKTRKSSTETSQRCQSLVFIGGANPDGAFNDAFILDFGEIE